MNRRYPTEFVFQALALVLSVIFVHAIYVVAVRPTAEAVLAEQRARMDSESDYVPETSAWVILRDYEQEACFVLMLWAMAIMGLKGVTAARERHEIAPDGLAKRA